MRLNLEIFAAALGDSLLSVIPGKAACDALNTATQCEGWESVVPSGAQIDSREVREGDMFFCLPGERADGHDFAFAAAQAGSVAIIASREPFTEECRRSTDALPPVFMVRNVQEALWRMAMRHRYATAAKVIGITGSAGKTSVKEALAAVLSQKGATDRNPMNLNNQIGLPLSMLNASPDSSYWVMEAGISEAHDMDELGRILRPDMAIILNVGDAHLSGLGDKGVAAYKSRLLDYIQPHGIAYVSADYHDLSSEVDGRKPEFTQKDIQCEHFSAHETGAVYCTAVYQGPSASLGGKYKVTLPDQEFMVEAPFIGDFGNENVAAIAGAAHLLDIESDAIAKGLANVSLPGQRFNCTRVGASVLIDDSYNANPLSAKRMVQAAAAMATQEALPLVLVMGEMLELGDRAESAHEELGKLMAGHEPKVIFWKGGQTDFVKRGLAESGYTGDFFPVAGGQEFALLLEECGPQEALYLFKGSRGNKLERLVDIFRDRAAQVGEDHAV